MPISFTCERISHLVGWSELRSQKSIILLPFCLTIAKNSNTSPLFKLLSFTNISNMQSKNSKYLPTQSLTCEVYRKKANKVKDLLPQSHRMRKINHNMHKAKYKLFCCSHVQSLGSNVRKAGKISNSLYPLYSYLWFEQCKKKSVFNKSKIWMIFKHSLSLGTICLGSHKSLPWHDRLLVRCVCYNRVYHFVMVGYLVSKWRRVPENIDISIN